MKTLLRKGKSFKGYTIGLDLHQSFIQVVVLDKKGDNAESKRIGFKKEALEKLLAPRQRTFRNRARRFQRQAAQIRAPYAAFQLQ